MNRKLLILFFIAMSGIGKVAAQSLRKLAQLPFHVVESKWEENAQGDVELNYYNSDYCDYYMWRRNDGSYNLRCGKNRIFTIKKESQVGNMFKKSSEYSYYRGRFPKNFRIETLYALPVKSGKKISWRIDLLEPLKTLNFYLEQNDTVYATRGGIACKTIYLGQLLIYHPDCTFAAYLRMKENFILPGEKVHVGQPIGLANEMGVSVSYFFLDENKFKGDAPSGYPYSHFMPVFHTGEGDVRLKEKTVYHAVIDDALIMQDMTKREQKKYLKRKNK